MLGKERYAFKDVNHDPDKKFPEFMTALRRYDSAYDIVWDRQIKRWVCITWLSDFNYRGSTPPKEIFIMQNEDGTYMHPHVSWIGFLKDTDWRSKSKTIAEHSDLMDKLSEENTARLEKKMHDAWVDYNKPWHDYIAKQPTTIRTDGLGELVRSLKTAGFSSPKHWIKNQKAIEDSHQTSTGT